MKIDDTVQIAQLGGREKDEKSARLFAAMIALSLCLHASAVGAFAALNARPRRNLDLSRAIPVQLVKLGKPRAPELLPRKVAPPPPAPKSEGVALDDGKKKPDPAKKPESAKEPELSDAAKRLLDTPSPRRLDDVMGKFEEAEGSPDGDLHGTTTDATNAATGYHRDIVRALKEQYRVPEVIPASQRQFLKARVVLFIEKNGQISAHEFVERHPNKIFMSALETMLKSVKLPPPPKDLARAMRDDGVEILFTP